MHFVLNRYLGVKFLDGFLILCLNKKLSSFFPSCRTISFTPATKSSCCSTFSLTFRIFSSLNFSHSNGLRCYCSVNFHIPITTGKYFFMCFLAIYRALKFFYNFQMYDIIVQHLYTLQCDQHASLVTIHHPFCLYLKPLPFW